MHVGLFTNIIDHVLEIMRFPDKVRPVVYGTNEIIKMKNYNVKTIIGQQVRCLKCDSCSEILPGKFYACKQRVICNDPLLPSTVRVLLCVSAVFGIIQALVIKLITFPKFIRLPIFAFLHLFRINSDRPRHLHGKLHVGAERQQANWVVVYTRSASLSRNL